MPLQIGERGIESFHFWRIFVSKLHQPRQGWGGENLMSSCLALMSQREREREGGRDSGRVGEEERERRGRNRLVAGILDAYSDRFHQLPGSSPLPSIPPQRTAPIVLLSLQRAIFTKLPFLSNRYFSWCLPGANVLYELVRLNGKRC